MQHVELAAVQHLVSIFVSNQTGRNNYRVFSAQRQATSIGPVIFKKDAFSCYLKQPSIKIQSCASQLPIYALNNVLCTVYICIMQYHTTTKTTT